MKNIVIAMFILIASNAIADGTCLSEGKVKDENVKVSQCLKWSGTFATMPFLYISTIGGKLVTLVMLNGSVVGTQIQ